jgi:hypothetical protein
MKPRHIGAILAGLAFAAWACKGDPTAGLRGGPTSLTVVPEVVFIDPGATKSIEVSARDAQLNPVVLDVTATSAAPAIATVAVDTTRPFPDASRHAFIVTGVGASGGSTVVRFQGGSLKDSSIVNIN